MKVDVTLIGTKELQKKLDIKNVTQPLDNGIKKATLLLDREVKQATVVDTGVLRSSIASQFGAMSGQVGTRMEYAPFVEFGTYKMEARHLEGGTKMLGEGMFAFGLRKLGGKMKELLGDIANKIEARWK